MPSRKNLFLNHVVVYFFLSGSILFSLDVSLRPSAKVCERYIIELHTAYRRCDKNACIPNWMLENRDTNVIFWTWSEEMRLHFFLSSRSLFTVSSHCHFSRRTSCSAKERFFLLHAAHNKTKQAQTKLS